MTIATNAPEPAQNSAATTIKGPPDRTERNAPLNDVTT
jgi:hypothetical protein